MEIAVSCMLKKTYLVSLSIILHADIKPKEFLKDLFQSFFERTQSKTTPVGLTILLPRAFDCIRQASLNHDDENKSLTGLGEPGFTIAQVQIRNALANREPTGLSSLANRQPTGLSSLAKRDQVFSGLKTGRVSVYFGIFCVLAIIGVKFLG